MNTGPLVAILALTLAACANSAVHERSETGAAAQAGVIVTRAEAMVGQPYRYGGAAPGGFDCSGLVDYATRAAGLHLPRTARDQLHAGSRIARHNLRPGDLVFLHLSRRELHVGIALGGDRFVHAPSHGGTVRIDSLTAAPYARSYLEARRVTD